MKLLFILSGSIACYKACEVISQLVQRGHAVRTVATDAAREFVGAATLEGLTGHRVQHELFAAGRALEHIALGRWADATIVCPATANTINRLAAGMGDDLAGALLLAHEWHKPLLIAPAMNPAMWSHPATVAAVARLRSWGARIIEPATGRTACGETGAGRLAEPAEVLAAIEAAGAAPAQRWRILVTAGGTAEPLDRIRFLTNLSTGATGSRIARYLHERGHEVLLLRARHALPIETGAPVVEFGSFAELDGALTDALGSQDFDIVIHAAAVGDFSIAAIEANGARHDAGAGKLAGDVTTTVRLQPNAKLLTTLRQRSRKANPRVVAFKLTAGASEVEARQAVTTLLASGAADFVVHNDIEKRDAAGAFPADIWSAEGKVVAHCADRAEIAPMLEAVLGGSAGNRTPPQPAGRAPAPA